VVTPPDGLYGETLDALCGVLDRCGTSSFWGFASRAHCQAVVAHELSCSAQEDVLGDETSVRFVSRVAELTRATTDACVAALNKLDCALVRRPQVSFDTNFYRLLGGNDSAATGPCSALFQQSADAQEGQACGDVEGEQRDCFQGLYCAAGTSGAPSTCKPLPTSGPCAMPDLECAAEAYCARINPQDPNTARECRPRLADGEACNEGRQCSSGFCRLEENNARADSFCSNLGNQGDACTFSNQCFNGLFCEPETSSCQPRRRSGEACQSDTECASLSCSDENGLCGKILGAACNRSEDCQSSFCGADSTCSPGGQSGDACQNGSQCASGLCNLGRTCAATCEVNSECESGTYCRLGLGVNGCEATKSEGATCRDHFECQSGYCDPDDRCTKVPQEGDACQFDETCGLKLYCAEGTCKRRKTSGSRCPGGASCLAPYICQYDRCVLKSLSCTFPAIGETCTLLEYCTPDAFCDTQNGFVCKKRRAEGEQCATNSDCVAGLDCNFATASQTFVCARS